MRLALSMSLLSLSLFQSLGAQEAKRQLLGPSRTAAMRFTGASGSVKGYESATITVSYQFLACGAGLYIGFSPRSSTVTLGTVYWYNGERHEIGASSLPGRVTSVGIDGVARQREYVVGTFGDGASTADFSQHGCYGGNTKQVAQLPNGMTDKSPESQVLSYLGSLHATFSTPDVLENGSVESMILDRKRRAEREKADRIAAERAAAQKADADWKAAEQARVARGTAPAGAASPAPVPQGRTAEAERVAAAQRAEEARRAADRRAADSIMAKTRADNEQWARDNAGFAAGKTTSQAVGEIAGNIGTIMADRAAAKRRREEARAREAALEREEAAANRSREAALVMGRPECSWTAAPPIAFNGFANFEASIFTSACRIGQALANVHAIHVPYPDLYHINATFSVPSSLQLTLTAPNGGRLAFLKSGGPISRYVYLDTGRHVVTVTGIPGSYATQGTYNVGIGASRFQLSRTGSVTVPQLRNLVSCRAFLAGAELAQPGLPPASHRARMNVCDEYDYTDRVSLVENPSSVRQHFWLEVRKRQKIEVRVTPAAPGAGKVRIERWSPDSSLLVGVTSEYFDEPGKTAKIKEDFAPGLYLISVSKGIASCGERDACREFTLEVDGGESPRAAPPKPVARIPGVDATVQRLTFREAAPLTFPAKEAVARRRFHADSTRAIGVRLHLTSPPAKANQGHWVACSIHSASGKQLNASNVVVRPQAGWTQFWQDMWGMTAAWPDSVVRWTPGWYRVFCVADRMDYKPLVALDSFEIVDSVSLALEARTPKRILSAQIRGFYAMEDSVWRKGSGAKMDSVFKISEAPWIGGSIWTELSRGAATSPLEIQCEWRDGKGQAYAHTREVVPERAVGSLSLQRAHVVGRSTGRHVVVCSTEGRELGRGAFEMRK